MEAIEREIPTLVDRLVAISREEVEWLEAVPGCAPVDFLRPLLLGIENDRPWLYDPATGERLPDHAEAVTKAREEAKARKKAEARAKRAENKARKEAEARAELEKQVRELQKQLRRRTPHVLGGVLLGLAVGDFRGRSREIGLSARKSAKCVT